VLEIVLGNRYQVPETGPVAVYRRLLRGYADGDWTAALSAARQLELGDPPSARALAFARIFAAEMCAVRGENDQAEQWLADVVPDQGYEALHAWVVAGMLWRGGDPAAAVRLARQDRWHDSASYGLDRLLSRAATAAVAAGDRVGAASILRTLESRFLADPTRIGEERVLLARGMVNRDRRAAAASIDLARDHHRTFDLLVGQLALGESAEDADEVLPEAYRPAARVGVDGLRRQVADELHARDIPPRAVSTEFSAVEQQVIAMVRRGRTNRQIASALGVRPKTVEIYLTRLLAKTGTRSRVELIAASLSA
jgi:DNA-binding CsgD family transcriptional regulator